MTHSFVNREVNDDWLNGRPLKVFGDRLRVQEGFILETQTTENRNHLLLLAWNLKHCGCLEFRRKFSSY